MRKFIILSTLFSCFALFQLQAQQDVKIQTETVDITADKVAAADENIDKSVCPHSGKVSYYKKAICPMTGKVSKQRVEWDEAEAKFVSLSKKEGHQDKMKKGCCSGKKSKSCSKKCSKKCGKSAKSAEASADLIEQAKKDAEVLGSGSL